MTSSYRPEIDGLRAIAVLPVVLYHAGVPGFSGGFVGVDVFFVISGYLITRIIQAEVAAGVFSIYGFYERRVRRIIPAFFLVAATAVAVAWFVLLPMDMEEFARSLAAAATFVSNIWIWGTISYFDHAAELMPLLHTWSLAVEEQFYLLYPLVLAGLLRWGVRRAALVLMVVAVASLALAEWGSRNSPSATFYFLPTRGWELLVGAGVALFPACVSARLPFAASRLFAELACAAGLGLVLLSVTLYDGSVPYPGRYALVPVAGAALLISFSGAAPFVANVLNNRPAVVIGMTSYSLYLWHYVILSLVRHRSLLSPTAAELALACVGSLALAIFTWRVIEVPFRDRGRFTRRQVFAGGAVCVASLVAVGWAGAASGGWPGRVPPEARVMEATRLDRNPRSAECHSKEKLYIRPQSACVAGDASKVVGAILGDSHADALAFLLGRRLGGHGVGMLQLSYSACPPVAGLYREGADSENLCAEYNAEVSRYVVAQESLRHIVLVARWPLYFEGARFDNGEGGVEWGPPVVLRPVGLPGDAEFPAQARKAAFATSLADTVRRFLDAGKLVTVVYAIPEVGVDVPAYMAKIAWRESEAAPPLTTSRRAYVARVRDVHKILDDLGQHAGLARVRPEFLFCGQVATDRCETVLGGAALYFDDNHPSSHGADLVIRDIVESVTNAVDSLPRQ